MMKYNVDSDNAANIHQEYQRRLNGNARGVNLPVTDDLDDSKVPVSIARVSNPSDSISRDQSRFYVDNQRQMLYPTLFDVQNTQLKIGGAPLWNRERDEKHRLPPHKNGENTSFTVPYSPQQDLGNVYMNPLPFDYNNAVRANHPPAYTFASEDIRRMMRSPDEIDPELVTNPIPDPTFQARQPTFNHAPEDAEMLRMRTQRNGPFRFW